MKKVVLALILAGLATASQAAFVSGKDILDRLQSKRAVDREIATAYILGVHDAYSPGMSCVDEKTPASSLTNAVQYFLARNPELWQTSADTAIIGILMHVWPCKDTPAEKKGKVTTMNKPVAKPIIANQFWVITDGDNKIGNIQVTGSEVLVRFQNQVGIFPDLDSIRDQIDFVADTPKEVATTKKDVYNVTVDVSRKLKLFTTSPVSKCFYAEGWFVMSKDDVIEVVENPKYIFVTRYRTLGPFASKQEAELNREMV